MPAYLFGVNMFEKAARPSISPQSSRDEVADYWAVAQIELRPSEHLATIYVNPEGSPLRLRPRAFWRRTVCAEAAQAEVSASVRSARMKDTPRRRGSKIWIDPSRRWSQERSAQIDRKHSLVF
jgi:hypothetical protein